MSATALVTGATGFIGSRLAARLQAEGVEVRCLVRDRTTSRARALEHDGFALHEGDVLRPETLHGAGHGIDVTYYLIHSMGRGGSRDFAPRERAAAIAFARMARAEGIERVVYLGGLGEQPQSEHLRSRHQTAQPDVLTYAEMLDRMAEALGLPHRPRIPVPLIEGLAIPTVVADPSGMELFDVEPIGFDEDLRSAVAGDSELPKMTPISRLLASQPTPGPRSSQLVQRGPRDPRLHPDTYTLP